MGWQSLALRAVGAARTIEGDTDLSALAIFRPERNPADAIVVSSPLGRRADARAVGAQLRGPPCRSIHSEFNADYIDAFLADCGGASEVRPFEQNKICERGRGSRD